MNAFDLSQVATEACLALDKNIIPLAARSINLILNSQDTSSKINALATVICKIMEKNIFFPGVIDRNFYFNVIMNSGVDGQTKISALTSVVQKYITLHQIQFAVQLTFTLLNIPAEDKVKADMLVNVAKSYIDINNFSAVYEVVNYIKSRNVVISIKQNALQQISLYCLQKDYIAQSNFILAQISSY